MSRSAYLPDRAVLTSLLERARGDRSSPARLTVTPPTARSPSLPSAPGTTKNPSPSPEVRASESPAPNGDWLAELHAVLGDRTSLDTRFQRFVTWLEQRLGASAVFVADAEGLAMVESNAREGYLVAAGEIGAVLNGLSALLPDVEEGSTTLRLKGGGSVELIGCKTELGRFTVGLVLDRPLDPAWPAAIRAALLAITAMNNPMSGTP